MTHSDRVRKKAVTDPLTVARRMFGFSAFRPGQEPAIRALLQGHDVLAVLPTGGGKSAIYQVTAAVVPGPTVVISPLIALQHDQAQRLESPHAGGAAVVNSTVTVRAQHDAFEELEEQTLEFIFLAPEQLQRTEVMERLRESQPSLLVVDEAHCISEWGHDFRPDYLRLGSVIDALGHPLVLALTATAPAQVREEIVERLGMRKPRVILGDLDRRNIRLAVVTCRDSAAKTETLLERVQDAQFPGIVYVATRRHAEELAEALGDVGVNAARYHAGINKREREAVQEEFMAGDVDVIVATSAFGMGIDKPNVRFVYHFDIPASVDAYYQELGRAGRDGKPAEALLLYRPQDLNLHKFFAGGGRLRPQELATVGEAIREAGSIELEQLRHATGLSRTKVAQAAAELEDQGLLDQSADDALRAPRRDADLEAAGDAMRKRQGRYRARLLQRLELMRVYAEMLDCRRRYLLDYFGQPAKPCGHCDNCEAGLPAETKSSGGEPFPVRSRVVHRKLGKGMVTGYEGGRVRILFDEHGEKLIDLALTQAHDLLHHA